MNVVIERNDRMTEQILRVVRLHAEADTRENSAEFRLTPAQATLVWWGMKQFEAAIKDAVRWAEDWDTRYQARYSDTLRCYADADEWSRDFRHQLSEHARAHNLEVSKCV